MIDFVTGQPIVVIVGMKDYGHTWVLFVVVVVVEVGKNLVAVGSDDGEALSPLAVGRVLPSVP